MPFTRIILAEEFCESKLADLSALLHQSLVDEFTVPADDCFQVFERVAAGQRIFDKHYLSGTRSDKFVQFHIVAGKPRSSEQKANFYRVLSERLSQQLNIHPDDVMVIIQFNNAEDWSFSGGEQFTLSASQ